MSEEKQFLEELDQKPDILEQPLEVQEEKPEEDGEKLKNRRERRLYDRYEKRGEEVNNLAEEVVRLRNIVEVRDERKNATEAEYLKVVERIYGNDTPEKREATETLKQALQGVHESARKEALEEALNSFRAERESESQAVQQEESTLDEMMESLEDEYGADFSNESTRKGFLTLLEKLSPKDKEGNIKEFADPYETYEIYESRKEKSSSRAKELAGKSMERGGGSQPSNLQQNAAERFLKENGII